MPVLSIKVVPGAYSDPSDLLFNWTFVAFNPEYLVLQLNFENPTHVSNDNKYKEYLRIQIFGIQLFVDQYSNFMYPEIVLNLQEIPNQDEQKIIQTIKYITGKV